MGLFLNRGNEEFERVVNSDIYVDKTDMVFFFSKKLNTEQCYISVSRPRRFGKSIAANMLAAYFEKGCDSRGLFENRKLGQMENWDKNLNKYDVIRVDLADIRSRYDSAKEALDFIEKGIVSDLQIVYEDCGIEDDDKVATALDRVNAVTGNRFIIIIDEWDCLFRDDKEDTKMQDRYINLLRGLFKGNSSKKFLALAYITGILPIKKYNSESALNNFYEYTMLSPGELARYIGFTQSEVRQLCEKYGMNYDKAMEWYDGYSFKCEKHICGPNSVVRAMLGQEYENYWSQTVAFNSLASYITMNFDGLRDAITVMIGGQRVKVRVRTYQNDMVSFNSRHDVMTVLIHLGYLAYDSENEEAYIPNKEVRQIFEDALEITGWDELVKTINDSERLLNATISGDADMVAQMVDYSHMVNTSILTYNDENSLASSIMLAYYSARRDYHIVREMPAGYGFADMVFVPKRNVDKPAMVLELKWKKDALTAIDQIKERKYVAALDGYKGEILMVGINYDKGDEEGKGNAKKHTCVIERVDKE